MSRKLSQKDQALWDRVTSTVRRLGGGVVPEAPPEVSLPAPRSNKSPVLDLHGMTLTDAHRTVLAHIEDAALEGKLRYVTIITGLSGSIHEEFPRWLESHKDVRIINPLRGGGAFEVWLRKKGTSTRTR